MLLHAEELATERDGAVAADVSTGAGDDGTNDRGKAVHLPGSTVWLLRASKLGHRFAQKQLGWIYLHRAEFRSWSEDFENGLMWCGFLPPLDTFTCANTPLRVLLVQVRESHRKPV